jgi:fermentation-respiration switch protein FrsA (DUF1100 family)
MNTKEEVVAPKGSKKRLLWIPFGLAMASIGAVLGVSSYTAYSMTKVARVPIDKTPAEYDLQYKDVTFSSGDGLKLSGWWLEAGNDKPCILTVHGEKGNRIESGGMKILDIGRELVLAGYNVLMFDLRGHGQSEGKRASAGHHEKKDIVGAIQYIKERGIGKIGVLGFSMGAATALMTAAQCPEIDAIIADSSFADLGDIVQSEFSKRSNLPGFFLTWTVFIAKRLYGIDLSALKPVEAVKKTDAPPVLFIHGGQDDMIPVEHAKVLVKSSSNHQSKLWIVPAAQHVGSYAARPKEYGSKVISFFDKVLSTN